MNPQNKIQNTIFWIEVEKIVPNPYQPRREFDEDRLKELSDSIRQYGILQPLVVSRKEDVLENGGIQVRYELIAGERRLRASKMAGLSQVPVVVRVGDDNREMLELAIIENLQREDLNAVDRAKSFQRLADEFKLTWTDVGKKLGKSREYVSNTVRILMLPQDILDALSKGHITEGHTRPLLMLIERPEEQMTLFKEMLIRKMTVREAEKIARTIAFEKIRKRSLFMTPEVVDTEEKLAEALGTRVQIEPREKGGKILIEYFSHDEFLALSILLKHAGKEKSHKGMFDTIREQDVENLKANATEYMPRKEIEPFEQKTSLTPSQALTGALAGALGPATTVAMSTPAVSEATEAAPNSITETMAEALPEVYRESDHSFELATTVKENLPLTEEEAFSTNPGVVAQIAMDEVTPQGELDDRSTAEVKKDEQEEDLYNIKDFTL
jgi:ParB family chromosome partitioning protein